MVEPKYTCPLSFVPYSNVPLERRKSSYILLRKDVRELASGSYFEHVKMVELFLCRELKVRFTDLQKEGECFSKRSSHDSSFYKIANTYCKRTRKDES